MSNQMAAETVPTGQPEEGSTVLTVRDLVTHFPVRGGVVKAVDGVSFTVHRGKTLCIVGESGSGKSVTARSILKIVGTELYQEATELAMDAMGHDAMGWFDAPAGTLPEHERWVASQFNYLRAATIYGGSNEIQKNIIAKQILRLPGA